MIACMLLAVPVMAGDEQQIGTIGGGHAQQVRPPSSKCKGVQNVPFNKPFRSQTQWSGEMIQAKVQQQGKVVAESDGRGFFVEAVDTLKNAQAAAMEPKPKDLTPGHAVARIRQARINSVPIGAPVSYLRKLRQEVMSWLVVIEYNIERAESRETTER